jgi:exodeoxyribonuclease VII small subunit
MESDEVSLEDSFALYKEGIELIKECNEKIEKVEKQIKLIEGNETDGEF